MYRHKANIFCIKLAIGLLILWTHRNVLLVRRSTSVYLFSLVMFMGNVWEMKRRYWKLFFLFRIELGFPYLDWCIDSHCKQFSYKFLADHFIITYLNTHYPHSRWSLCCVLGISTFDLHGLFLFVDSGFSNFWLNAN